MKHQSESIPTDAPDFHYKTWDDNWCGMDIQVTTRHKVIKCWPETNQCEGGYSYDENGHVTKIEIIHYDDVSMWNALNGHYDLIIQEYAGKVTGCHVPNDVEFIP